MSGPLKVFVVIVAGLFGIYLAFKILTGLLAMLIPVAILAALGFVIYTIVVKGNMLPGGRRYLP